MFTRFYFCQLDGERDLNKSAILRTLARRPREECLLPANISRPLSETREIARYYTIAKLLAKCQRERALFTKRSKVSPSLRKSSRIWSKIALAK